MISNSAIPIEKSISGIPSYPGGFIGHHGSYGDILRRLGIHDETERHKKKGKFGYKIICSKCHHFFHSEYYDDIICDWCEKGIGRDSEGKVFTHRRREYLNRKRNERRKKK